MRGVLAAALRRLAHRLEPAPPYVVVQGEAIVRAIKRRNLRRGLPPNAI